MADDDKTTYIIMGGTVLFILLISAFFIADEFGLSFFDAILLLFTHFLGPVILLAIAYFSVVLLSQYTPLKINETPIGSITAFFVFCFLLVIYGAALGFYPIELITNNLVYLIFAFAGVAIVSYIILKVRQIIFGGRKTI